MASILNVPEIKFPVEFSQRLNGEDTRTFLLRENPDTGITEMTLKHGEDIIFRAVPLFVNNFAGINIADADYVFYGWTPGDSEPDVTQENLFDDIVEIRALKK